jgi:hypothetical protein
MRGKESRNKKKKRRRDLLFRVEELAVRASADLVGDGWLKVNKDATGDVLAGTSFGEKGVEGVVTTTDSFV